MIFTINAASGRRRFGEILSTSRSVFLCGRSSWWKTISSPRTYKSSTCSEDGWNISEPLWNTPPVRGSGNSQLKELRLDKSDYCNISIWWCNTIFDISLLSCYDSLLSVCCMCCVTTQISWTIIICFQKRFWQVASWTHSPIVRYAVLNYACISRIHLP